MSQQMLEERVGKVEDGLRNLSSDMRVISHDQQSMRGEMSSIGTDIKKLLERDAKRPQAMTWQTIAATCVGIAAVAGVGWWLIETAPAVREINGRIDKVNERVTRLDDPEIGRVPTVERKLRDLEMWQPKVTKY